MRLVVDSNIVFSLIISGSSGRVYRLLKDYSLSLYAPEEVICEFREYTSLLKEKAKEFEKRVLLAFSLLTIVPFEVYSSEIQEALRIASMFDAKDAPFIALALKLGIPLWTEDKDVLRHSFASGKYVALDTAAVEELLKGKDIKKVLKDLRSRLGL